MTDGGRPKVIIDINKHGIRRELPPGGYKKKPKKGNNRGYKNDISTNSSKNPNNDHKRTGSK